MSKRRLLLMLLLCLPGTSPVRPVQAGIPLPLTASPTALSPTDRIDLPLDLFLVTDHPAQGIVRHPRHAAITA
jgi:hypothetical protein